MTESKSVFDELRELDEEVGGAALWPNNRHGEDFWEVIDVFRIGDGRSELEDIIIGTGPTPEAAVSAAKAFLEGKE
jgi:hypothetical protein